MERRLQVEDKPNPAVTMAINTSSETKNYTIQFLRSEAISFEACEVNIEPQEGVFAFYGPARELIFLIPIDSVKCIEIKKASPDRSNGVATTALPLPGLGLPEWMSRPVQQHHERGEDAHSVEGSPLF